jgi:Domain of unknown function (DUF2760)
LRGAARLTASALSVSHKRLEEKNGMAAHAPHFPARLWLSLVCFVRVIFDPEFAREVKLLRERGPEPSGRVVQVVTTASGLLTGTPIVPTPAASPTPAEERAERAAEREDESEGNGRSPRYSSQTAPLPSPGGGAREGALHLLALLQREGRLLDFCEEELSGFSDADVGAAARAVHAGCRKVLHQGLKLVPVRGEAEGAPAVVERGFDARAIRLTGRVVGDPPFRGTLRHHGWRASEVMLPDPPRGDAAAVLAPAEVELT